MMTNIFRAI